MRRVHVVGYYGWDNFGDDLFQATVSRNSDLIWGSGATVRSFVTPIRRLHQGSGLFGKVTRLMEAIVGGIWGDTIALCGGSVLEDVTGTQRTRARLLGKKKHIEAIGVSLGPWRSPAARERVRMYVKDMDRVVVRDQASQDRFGESENLQVGGDLAALYPMPATREHERTHLTICPSRDSGASAAQVVRLLSTLLTGIQVPIKIVALNMRPGVGDLEFATEIWDQLRRTHTDVELVRYRTVEQTIEVISRSRAVWSQRLHGLIVAYLCDVPILALSHHKKIADFVDHIGLPREFVHETLEIDPGVALAAASTLQSTPQWTISPEDYISRARAAFAVSRRA